MRIGILGPGALGTCFGVHLGRSGHRIVVLARTQQAWLGSVGLRLEGSAGARSVRCEVADPVRPSKLDMLFVFVKSHQTRRALEQWQSWLRGCPLTVSLQNGLLHVDLLRERFARLVLGTTSQGAFSLGPGHACHSGCGPTHVQATALGAEVGKLLGKAGIPTEEVPDLDRLLWEKLAVSSAINPVSALLGLENGEILRRPAALDLAVAAARETWSVGRALGIGLADEDPAERVRRVCRNTAANLSSMCADLRRGVSTEIESISLAVVRAAASRNLSAPINHVLGQLVLARQATLPERPSEVHRCVGTGA